jgi:CTP:molybdopterin cytidylyltransferase MocA
MSFPAIVLAAGSSMRLGRPKQLVEYEGETLLARAIRLTHEAGADPVFAVLGANLDVILPAGLRDGAVPVINKDWQQGVSSSIQAGLRAVHGMLPATEGVCLLACDQPRLSSQHLRALLRAFSSDSGAVIVASRYEGVLGTPAVFPRSAFRQLFELRGDKGARTLFSKPPCRVVEVPFPGGEIDIDTPADLDGLT